MKTYKLECYGKTYNIALRRTTYADNKTLAVVMYLVRNGKIKEEWSVLTVNLENGNATDKMAYIDTNNNGVEITDWLVENGIAINTYEMGFSGFCAYPLMCFNIEDIPEIEE